MTEPSWRPLFRTPRSTVTRVLHSPAFCRSRDTAGRIIESPRALRGLADLVETLDHENAPLASIADRAAAAVSYLRDRADRIDVEPSDRTSDSADGVADAALEAQPGAAAEARGRLLVAALHYLVTPDDMVPDFRPGGYIDDVLLLSWVFGAAASELKPYLEDDPFEDDPLADHSWDGDPLG